MDKLYDHDVSSLYQDLAEQVVKYLGLPCDVVHLDSTSFHVDGEYHSDIDAQGIRLVKGYNRYHRTETKSFSIQLQRIRQACSGNTNDSIALRSWLNHIV